MDSWPLVISFAATAAAIFAYSFLLARLEKRHDLVHVRPGAFFQFFRRAFRYR